MVENPPASAGDTSSIPDWADPKGRRVAKPVHRSYWLHALEPGSCNYWAHVPQLLEPVHPSTRAPQQEEAFPRNDDTALKMNMWPKADQLMFFLGTSQLE